MVAEGRCWVSQSTWLRTGGRGKRTQTPDQVRCSLRGGDPRGVVRVEPCLEFPSEVLEAGSGVKLRLESPSEGLGVWSEGGAPT